MVEEKPTEEKPAEEKAAEEVAAEERPAEEAAEAVEAEKPKMTGRVVIITGATSGMGFKAAQYMCEAGDNVILAAKNPDRGKFIAEKIKNKNPQALVTFLQLDLSSKESIEKFVENFRALGKKLSILINNAGMLLGVKDTRRQTTAEGFEMTMGTNYFGHWLLTHLLLEDLKKTASDDGDARIINVVCSAHDPTASRRHTLKEFDLEDVLLTKPAAYSGGQAYKDSKAALVMYTYELAKQLEGSNVCVNAVCPGYVPATQLYRNCQTAHRYFNKIVGGMFWFLKAVTTVDKAAESLSELADEAKYKGVSGKYFKDRKETESSEESRVEEKQKSLWNQTGGFWKLDGFEPLEIPQPAPEPEPETKKEEKKEEETKDEEAKEEKVEDENKDEEGKKDEEKLVVEEKEKSDEKEKIEDVKEDKKEEEKK